MKGNPTIRINGKRYIATKMKAGAYRQIMQLVEIMQDIEQDEMHEDMLEAIRLTFDLTQEQADQVNVADIIPTFAHLSVWAKRAFLLKAALIPNEEGPEATTGQN